MKIESKTLLDVIGMPETRFAVPVFQRVYSWDARQCEELWADVMRSGKTGEAHFAGMLLVSRDADSWRGLSQLNVIDGQQRLTTLTLLLAALRGYVEKAPCGGVPGADDLAARYLLVDAGDAVGAKLALTGLDSDTLAAIVGADEPPEETARRLIDNYLLFTGKMEEPDFDAEEFWRGLSLLEVALVELDASDGPQTVFESLNSKGMALSTADRVRNLIVASADGDEQEHLFTEVWIPLEERAAAADPCMTMTDVLDAWLAQRYRSVRILDAGEVYGVFKTSLRDEYSNSLEQLFADVAAFLDQLLADADFRAEAEKSAKAWVAGKPEKSVSEFKLFGD